MDRSDAGNRHKTAKREHLIQWDSFFVINIYNFAFVNHRAEKSPVIFSPSPGGDHVCELNHGKKAELGDGDARTEEKCECLLVCMCVVAHINAIVYMHINGVYVCVGLTGWHIQRIIFD